MEHYRTLYQSKLNKHTNQLIVDQQIFHRHDDNEEEAKFGEPNQLEDNYRHHMNVKRNANGFQPGL